MRYQKIESHIWFDEKFTGLSHSAQLLFLYVLTSPHGNLAGIYVLKKGYACDDMKTLPEDFEKDLEELSSKELIRYDKATQVIWIKNFLKHNPLENRNQKISAIRRISSLPKSNLLEEFLHCNKEYFEGFSDPILNTEEESCDCQSKGKHGDSDVDGVSTGSSNPLPNPSKRVTKGFAKPGTGTRTGTDTDTDNQLTLNKTRSLETTRGALSKTAKNGVSGERKDFSRNGKHVSAGIKQEIDSESVASTSSKWGKEVFQSFRNAIYRRRLFELYDNLKEIKSIKDLVEEGAYRALKDVAVNRTTELERRGLSFGPVTLTVMSKRIKREFAYDNVPSDEEKARNFYVRELCDLTAESVFQWPRTAPLTGRIRISATDAQPGDVYRPPPALRG